MRKRYNMNNKLFDSKRIAEGYKDRPFLHKQVIEQLQKDIYVSSFHNGLDVGCGAGLSSKALKLICDRVTGTDISEEMILVAKEMCSDRDDIFFVSKAEEIPKPEQLYDIVTVAGVVQWMDADAFLNNLKSIIDKEGVVLVYDFWISDKMKEVPQYTQWYHNEYLKHFPKPSRNEMVWTDAFVQQYGFRMQKQRKLQLQYLFKLEDFIKFMMIQSNVSVKIEGEGQNEEDIKRWFEDSLREVFCLQSRELLFDGYIWYIYKNI